MAVYKRIIGGKKTKCFYMDFTVFGKRVFKSTKETTKSAAETAEALERRRLEDEEAKQRERRAGRLLEMSLSEAVNKAWTDRWQYTDTGELMRKRLDFCVKLCGDVKLADIDLQWVDALRRALTERENIRTLATVNRYLAHLSTLLNMAVDQWGVLNRAPKIKLYPEKKGRTRVLSYEEEDAVVAALRSADHRNAGHYGDIAELVVVLIDTGMRVSEALLMVYGKHIDLVRKVIRLTPDITKTHSERTVPMTNRVCSILTRRAKPHGRRAFPYTIDQVESAWYWVRKQLGYSDDKEFVPHALRHTCASRLIEKGVDLYTVKNLLGHSSIKTTERYAHMQSATLAQAVGLLGR